MLVLCLHQVNPRANPFWPALHPDRFAALLRWLSSAAEVVSFADLPTRAAQRRTRPLVILSFDDGYYDFVEYAMPILERFDMRANQNVIGESLLSGLPPHETRVCELLHAAPPRRLRPLRIPGLDVTLDRDHREAKERFGATVSNHVKNLPKDEAEGAVLALREALGVDPPSVRMMSAADVAAAARAGHEIGAHAYRHDSKATVPDEDFLEDFRTCRKALGEQGLRTRVYAFPNGSYRKSQVDILIDEGVEHVLLVEDRASRPTAHVHPRLPIRGEYDNELRVRAVGIAPP